MRTLFLFLLFVSLSYSQTFSLKEYFKLIDCTPDEFHDYVVKNGFEFIRTDYDESGFMCHIYSKSKLALWSKIKQNGQLYSFVQTFKYARDYNKIKSMVINNGFQLNKYIKHKNKLGGIYVKKIENWLYTFDFSIIDGSYFIEFDKTEVYDNNDE